MENKRSRIFTIIITALITFFLTTSVGSFITDLTVGESIEKISIVKEMLSEYSLFEVNEEKVADYAAMAMAASVEDPYTAYFPKDEFSAYKDNIMSSYVGMGAMLGADMEKDEITIVSTVEGGPADKAGLKSGDKIVSIDGESYGASRLTEASMYVKNGEEGTTFVLLMEREGKGKFEVTITREKIIKKSVESKMLANNIGYIKITGFESKLEKTEKDTYDEFVESLLALKGAGMEKMIIDLRDNPGGDFRVVCNIADAILPKGVITYTEDKYGKQEFIYSDSDELNIPIAVLVNGGSASSSEVLTGALKDHKKATVIGTKTYGKGIVQSVFPFTDGSGMSITTARYFTPSGVCIHKIGIEPDINVELITTKALSELSIEEDTQLKKAIEVLK
ncbi:MAG: S41 family peptidase [Clostridia bacterium]|nr:S41 family peptidase [Clostridia bacterium]